MKGNIYYTAHSPSLVDMINGLSVYNILFLEWNFSLQKQINPIIRKVNNPYFVEKTLKKTKPIFEMPVRHWNINYETTSYI